MEQLAHLATDAAWVFVIIIAFAFIGVYATIRWIVGLLTRGEQAVVNEVHSIEERLK